MRVLLLAMLALAAEAIDQLIMPTSRGIFYNGSIINVCHPAYFQSMWTLPVLVETHGPSPPYTDSFRDNLNQCWPVKITTQKVDTPFYSQDDIPYQIKVWSSAFMNTVQAVSYNFKIYQFPLFPTNGAFFHQESKQYIFPLAPRASLKDEWPFPVPAHSADTVEFWGYYYSRTLIPLWNGWNVKIGTTYSEISNVFNVAVPYLKDVYYFNLKFRSGLTGIITESDVGFVDMGQNEWVPYCGAPSSCHPWPSCAPKCPTPWPSCSPNCA